jgi:hypothetical protein
VATGAACSQEVEEEEEAAAAAAVDQVNISGFATCLFTTEDGGLEEEEEPDFANFVISG